MVYVGDVFAIAWFIHQASVMKVYFETVKYPARYRYITSFNGMCITMLVFLISYTDSFINGYYIKLVACQGVKTLF